MPIVFLATLGQRPEAITMAFDVLSQRYPYLRIGILHTDEKASKIADAYAALVPRLAADYSRQTQYHPLSFPNGAPIIDIVDSRSAEAYYRALLAVLKDYRQEGWQVHLLVSGGRKAMSIYASLAASLVFGSNDRIWTVLSDEGLMKAGVFHAPRGSSLAVQVVQLPFMPSRLLPGVLPEFDVDALLAQTTDSRERFLKSLSDEENALVEMLQAHPYISNQEIANHMSKSIKTIENQLTSIYNKLRYVFEFEFDDNRKRQVLMDVLAGRI